MHMLKKNSLCIFSVSTEELLGKHNFNTEDSKTIRVELVHIFFFACIKVLRKHFYCYRYISKFLLYQKFLLFLLYSIFSDILKIEKVILFETHFILLVDI